MDELVKSIETLSIEDFKDVVSSFIRDNEKTATASHLSDVSRQRLWTALFKHIDKEDSGTLLCLQAIKILSREKLNLEEYVTNNRLKHLLKVSGIPKDADCTSECNVEALKCLCNITYNLPSASDILVSFDAPILIAKRLSSYKDRKCIRDRKLFEIKLLFLITAFSVSSRKTLFEKYGLSLFRNLCSYEAKLSKDNIPLKRSKISISDDQIKVLCEVLKTTFNVLCNINSEESDKNEIKDFVIILRELILVGLSPRTEMLLRDIVNVLTLLPSECLEALLIPGHEKYDKNISESPSMKAVSVLIEFLDATLVKIEEVPAIPKEELSPILLLLTNLAKSNKLYRRFIRSRVLPYLKEIYTRPEVGSTLRNKLCRLLTCPITSTRDVVADFLFILCKESVGRMVKYTGYGNAAGLFANRGLLGDGHDYTNSDSEDSETEEYSQNKHMINPIVGCFTPPHTDETEEMTEEQKEHMALELVNKIDKLQRQGIIQPCRIGPDGKPTPIEHVLELQENPSGPRL